MAARRDLSSGGSSVQCSPLRAPCVQDDAGAKQPMHRLGEGFSGPRSVSSATTHIIHDGINTGGKCASLQYKPMTILFDNTICSIVSSTLTTVLSRNGLSHNGPLSQRSSLTTQSPLWRWKGGRVQCVRMCASLTVWCIVFIGHDHYTFSSPASAVGTAGLSRIPKGAEQCRALSQERCAR